MSTTYDGPLGLSFTVRPRDSQVVIGFDSTIVLVGPMDTANGSAAVGEVELISDEQDAIEKFGDNSTLHAAFVLASVNDAADIYGVGIDDTANDYTAATKAAFNVSPRYIVALTTDSTYITDAHTVVDNRATDDLEFARLWAPIHSGSVPDLQSHSGSDLQGFTPVVEDERLVQVAPYQATDSGQTALAVAAVAGQAARKPFGTSLAYDSVTAESLTPEYQPSAVSGIGNLSAVTKDNEVVDGHTTSAEAAFSDVFQMEIVDLAIAGVAEIAKEYRGNAVNTAEQRDQLEAEVRRFFNALTERDRPLLSQAGGGAAYSVTSSVGNSNEVTELSVAVSPVSVMKQINITFDVTDTISVQTVQA